MATSSRKPAGGCNPPEHARFKKGQSGNPAGRPPKSRDFKKLIEAELDCPVTLTENGKRVRISKREFLAKKLVNDAAKGDEKALAHLLKLVGGASAPENPTVALGAAELARFTLRYLPAPTSQETLEPGAEDVGEADAAEAASDGGGEDRNDADEEDRE
jgi:hypothetical protein